MNDKSLYSAIIRNAEPLGDKNVSHDTAKKVSFHSLFKRCQGNNLIRPTDITSQSS